MASAPDQTAAAILGDWDVTWRPKLAPALHGRLLLDEDGDGFAATLSGDADGSGSGEIIGTKLICTFDLGSHGGLRLEAGLVDGQLEGVIEPTGFPSPIDLSASLSGRRPGAAVEVRSREASDAIAETLQRCGIEHVFGYLGGPTPSMHRSILSHGIPSTAARTELGAAWMSYGYNRVRNRAASAALVWCVGAMHTTPVVYAARLDGTPLLMLTMESAHSWDVRDILQDAVEMNTCLKPISKYIRRLTDAEDAPLAVRQAILAASTGKFGPAVLNLTHSTMSERTTIPTEDLELPPPPAAAEQDVDRVIDLIKQAERPLILVGAGVHLAGAATELRAFAEATGIPVASSGIGGRGVLPDDHPLYAGGLGMTNTGRSAGQIAAEADLWVALGYSFSQPTTHSWTTPKPAKVVHVDIDPNQLGRIFQPTIGVNADVKAFLGQVLARVADEFDDPASRPPDPRVAAIEQARRSAAERLAAVAGTDPLTPTVIGAALNDVAPAETLIIGDEGFFMPGFSFSADRYPNGIAPVIGGHYMSMGSSLPTAIGAKLAAPERLVISYQGDGGFYYSCADLSYMAEHNLKIVVIVNNNLGLYGGRTAREAGLGAPGLFAGNPWLDLPDSTDFAGVAKAFGVPGETVQRTAGLAAALKRAIDADGPYLLDVHTDGAASWMQGEGDMIAAGPPPAKLGHLDTVVAGSWPA